MPRAVTATDLFLEEISGKLDVVIGLLGNSPQAQPADAPAAGEPEQKATVKKAPVKKASTRKRVTGQ
ncbi:MAG TPA: hypothetical protein VGH54_09550 [Mycobacterium sp.]|jgi:hypothetical protein|uniref:hypothetical protein n=1 Tax=Mycobacterium sp. TaxID=1785 RepID=UPI002F427366